MADNKFNSGPGGRLKREEVKNISFGFMRPSQKAIAEPSTTSVYQPTPEVAESRMYLQNKPFDLKNQIVADIANVPGLNVGNMSPEQYKKVATIIEELNKKHGNPIWKQKKGRPFYHPSENSINIAPEEQKDSKIIFLQKDSNDKFLGTKDRPDIYFQELAHASQHAKEPITSYLRGIKGKLFYEDNDIPNVGRYGTPGELEYEAHEEIAPQLWNDFKTLYKQKYGTDVPPQYQNRYEFEQLLADTPESRGGNLKHKGIMLPEVDIVAPVQRPSEAVMKRIQEAKKK